MVGSAGVQGWLGLVYITPLFYIVVVNGCLSLIVVSMGPPLQCSKFYWLFGVYCSLFFQDSSPSPTPNSGLCRTISWAHNIGRHYKGKQLVTYFLQVACEEGHFAIGDKLAACNNFIYHGAKGDRTTSSPFSTANVAIDASSTLLEAPIASRKYWGVVAIPKGIATMPFIIAILPQ